MSRQFTSAFMIAERQGVWSVTRDGSLYGDYRSREQAVASAEFGVRSTEERGGAACVVLQAGDQSNSK